MLEHLQSPHDPAAGDEEGAVMRGRQIRRRRGGAALLLGAVLVGGVVVAVVGSGPAPRETLLAPGPSSAPSAAPVSLAETFTQVLAAGGLPTADGQANLIPGPEHCDAQESLWLLLPLTTPDATMAIGYLRDPDRTVDSFAAKGAPAFASAVDLPADAAYSGFSFAGAELWLSPSDRVLSGYLVNVDDRRDVERWSALGGLCA